MKVVGTVAPDEVPNKASAFGVWTRLAIQAIEAHQAGQVLVVQVDDQEEAKKMVNGMAEKLRQGGYGRAFTTREEDGKLNVYCQLVERPRTPVSVVQTPTARPKRKQA